MPLVYQLSKTGELIGVIEVVDASAFDARDGFCVTPPPEGPLEADKRWAHVDGQWMQIDAPAIPAGATVSGGGV